MTKKSLKDAHKYSSNNRAQIELSNWCGCFYCQETFPAVDVIQWIHRRSVFGARQGNTALCPLCGIDSVIGDASAISLHPLFLEEMYQHWFERTKEGDELMKDP
mgnify:CR=1 FL=1